MSANSPISGLEKPWLMLPPKAGKGGATESRRSFAKFERYRDLPPSDRTLSRAAPLLGTSEKLLQKLSSKYWWQERLAAWDRREAEVRAEAMAEEQQRRAREEVAVWTKRKQELRERKFQTGVSFVEQGEAQRKLPTTERVMKGPDGKTITLRPRRTKDAVDMIRAGYQLQDEAVEDGLATSFAFEDVNEYEINDYLSTASDSPAADSTSGPAEPAEIP